MAVNTLTFPSTLATGTYTLTMFCAAGCRDSTQIQITQSSQPTGLSGGFGEGDYATLVQYAPFVPDQDQKASWSWNTYQNISNGEIEFGILNSIGGVGAVARSLTNSALTENLINTYKIGGDPNNPDGGRSFFFSLYGTPGTGYDGVTSPNPGQDTGFNPNPGGDYYLNRPPVLFYQRKNNSLYVRTKGYIWYPATSPTGGKEVNSMFHFWFTLEGKAVKYYILVENNRTDNQMIFQGREQEAPGCYSIANLWNQRIYLGNSPGAQEPSQRIDNFPGSGKSDTGGFLNAECWMGTTRNGTDQGLFLYTPYNSRFRGKQFGSTAGGADDNDSGYMNAGVIADMDNTSTTAYEGYLYIGTEPEMRSWITTKNTKRPFAFNFSGGKHQGFYTIDGRMKRINGEMIWYVGDTKIDQGNGSTVYGSKLFSPFGSWRASDIPTIYFNAAIQGVTELKVSWKKPGADVEFDSRIKRFTVSGNGSSQTYAIPMSGTSEWDGVITQVIFTHTRSVGGDTPDPNATVKLNWINKTNQAP